MVHHTETEPCLLANVNEMVSMSSPEEKNLRIVEYRVGKDHKDHLDQIFLAKSQSRQDGPAPGPAESLKCPMLATSLGRISGQISIPGCFFTVQMQLMLYLKLLVPYGYVFYLGGFLCHDGSRSQFWLLLSLAILCALQIPQEPGSVLYVLTRRPKLQKANPLQGPGFSSAIHLVHPQAPESAMGRRWVTRIPSVTHTTTGDMSRCTLSLETKEASNLSLKQLHCQ